MDAPESLSERYLQLINHIVDLTLKGQIRAKAQVGDLLSKGTEPGTAEIFERCLSHRLQDVETQITGLSAAEDFKLAKANRSLKALQTIDAEWNRIQTQNLRDQAVTKALTSLRQTQEPLRALSESLDPNRPDSLTVVQWGQFAQMIGQQLETRAETDVASHADLVNHEDLSAIVRGIQQGLASWQRLEGQVVGWIYEDSQSVGFGENERANPWQFWASQIPGTWLSQLFKELTNGDTVSWLIAQRQLDLADWVEAVIVLTFLHRALVSWCERQVYAAKLGRKILISIYLSFAVLWGQLSSCWQWCDSLPHQQRQHLHQHCLQLCLQVLQMFSEQTYFPLYGGVFATLGGQSLRRILQHLELPLQQMADSRSKARLLTLIAYTQQVQGEYDRAQGLYLQAFEMAQQLPDPDCVTANLNHLSRLYLIRKDYEMAVSYGQRALVLSRQQGNTMGEANALANLGFGEIFAVVASPEPIDPDICERAIAQLQRGAQLGEQLQDPQIQARCGCSLGIAYLHLAQPIDAAEQFAHSWKAAQSSGDIYLVGLHGAYLAQSIYATLDQTPAPEPRRAKLLASIVYSGCLGMYLLHQIGATEWQLAAAVMTKVQTELGTQTWHECLRDQRQALLPDIGVDGFDYIPTILTQYQASQDDI
jgi:tetratricopeptide (TPR) repeat protein